ncbi:MAG: SEC-C domain-containing protein [Nocardioides sp.]|nr:SEC-C domain-containing protein [Nocardioides sp.]
MDLGDVLDEIEHIDMTVPAEDRPAEVVRRADALEPGTVGRAEFLTCAADAYARIGAHERAEECARAAVTDGGPTTIDVRAWLVSILLLVGKHEEAIELADPLFRRLTEGNLPLDDADFVGEALEEAGHLDLAHRWFTVALRDVDPDAERTWGSSEIMLIHGRARVRRALNLPSDRFDAASTRQVRKSQAEFDSTYDLPPRIRPPRTADPASLALIYWPEPEFDKLIETWPELAEGYGDSFQEHRARMRRHLSDYAATGASPRVSAGSVDELVAFAAARGLDASSAETRSRYAAEIARLGRATAWPPGRNEQCWCGSGRKYKKCCGAPGVQ